MRKIICFVVLISLSSVLVSFAQAPVRSGLGDRIYFGGNFGFGFGSRSTQVDISPLVGYKFTERFSAGIGITYIYYKYVDPYSSYTIKTSIYGGDIFTRYFFLENVFGHAEVGLLNLDVPSHFYPFDVKRAWIPDFFVGGGYRQPMGEHSSFMIMLLYDLIADPNSPYTNPDIRVGFGFGI